MVSSSKPIPSNVLLRNKQLSKSFHIFIVGIQIIGEHGTRITPHKQREALPRGAPVRTAKRWENRGPESENDIVFAVLVSVISVSAFPVNSRYCGQLYLRFPISAFHTNTMSMKKKKSSDFYAFCTRI